MLPSTIKQLNKIALHLSKQFETMFSFKEQFKTTFSLTKLFETAFLWADSVQNF